MAKLRAWRWPGNVRELENVIERSVLMSPGDVIRADDILIQAPASEAVSAHAQGGNELTPGMTISEAERRLILKTLEYTNQNRTRAAQMLGISIRTLRNKLHEYGVARGNQEERIDG